MRDTGVLRATRSHQMVLSKAAAGSHLGSFSGEIAIPFLLRRKLTPKATLRQMVRLEVEQVS